MRRGGDTAACLSCNSIERLFSVYLTVAAFAEPNSPTDVHGHSHSVRRGHL